MINYQKPALYGLLLLLLAASLGPGRSFAQAPAPLWQRPLVSPANSAIWGIAHPFHRRVVAAGSARVGNNSRIYQARLWFLTYQGDTLGSIALPKASYEYTQADKVVSLANGDLLVVGWGHDQRNSGNNLQLSAFHFLMRTDSLGAVRWERRLNLGVAYNNVGPVPLAVLPDQSILVELDVNPAPGTQFSPVPRARVLRLDSLGNVRWQRTYGRVFGQLTSLVATPNGSYALAGYQQRVMRLPTGGQYLDSDAWLLRITANGDSVSSVLMGNSSDSEGWADVRCTPDGGLLLAGSFTPQHAPPFANPAQGHLMQFDSLGVPQWSHRIVAPQVAPFALGCFLSHLAILQSGDFVLSGYRFTGNHTIPGYLARWRPPTSAGTAPVPLWEQGVSMTGLYENQFEFSADGHLTLGGSANVNAVYSPQLTHYALPRRYEPQLCQRPPQPNAAYLIPPASPDSLLLYDASTAGPPYGTLVRWRWELGDGTVLVRETPAPVRHGYATVPPFGTPVRLTITNNLGCTATQVFYPWGGRPTAGRAAQVLAARFQLYPTRRAAPSRWPWPACARSPPWRPSCAMRWAGWCARWPCPCAAASSPSSST